MGAMKQLLNAQQLQEALERLADRVAEALRGVEKVALVGIRSRGDVLAQRLERLLAARGVNVQRRGVLDITLYRDDLDQVGGEARVRATEIEFDVSQYVLVLVDDVLYTGRTARAALDALVDLGRPKAIRLAVLVDRGGRELPIQADFVAVKSDQSDQHVQVQLKDVDGKDQVLVKRPAP